MERSPVNETVTRKLGSLDNVMAEFDAAARFLSLDADRTAFIREPRLSLRLNLPVRMDDGKTRTFNAYHTIHSIVRGPCIGGLQFRPGITQQLVDALAFWTTHSSALLGVPLSGSAGGVDCDPSMYSAGELERISRRYVGELSALIKPNFDIVTADIGTNQQVMCWIMDSLSRRTGRFTPGAVAGKPVDLGGTASTAPPVSIGVELCIRKACEYLRRPIRGSRVAIQGFGNVGMNVAKLLDLSGATVVAVADVSGAYYNPEGINVRELSWHQQSYGMLDGVEGEMNVRKLDAPLEIFELPVEIIVPAAIELQITEDNAERVKAKIIAEVAQDPVSPEADKMLYEKGVLVIPDVLCNSGGLAGSYLEWVQNRMGYYWTAQRVEQEVSRIVGQAFDSAMQIKRERRTPLRLAAAVLAVQRVAEAARMRGMYV